VEFHEFAACIEIGWGKLPLPKTIAIDGPAGSGKSTVSFAVARRLGYLFVDTGAFYRGLTLLALENGIDPHDSASIVALAQRTRLDMQPPQIDDGRQFTFLADGRDITHAINTPRVDAKVSIVAAHADVRAAVLQAQRDLAQRGNVIMAGRDIGTVVLPNADLKLYIDASLDKRAERRCQQRLRNGEQADLDLIREGLRRRDEIDSSRETSPLLQAPDAILIDTTELSLEETISKTYRIIIEHGRV
jgi:CMP/dCMP kinase